MKVSSSFYNKKVKQTLKCQMIKDTPYELVDTETTRKYITCKLGIQHAREQRILVLKPHRFKVQELLLLRDEHNVEGPDEAKQCVITNGWKTQKSGSVRSMLWLSLPVRTALVTTNNDVIII